MVFFFEHLGNFFNFPPYPYSPQTYALPGNPNSPIMVFLLLNYAS